VTSSCGGKEGSLLPTDTESVYNKNVYEQLCEALGNNRRLVPRVQEYYLVEDACHFSKELKQMSSGQIVWANASHSSSSMVFAVSVGVTGSVALSKS